MSVESADVRHLLLSPIDRRLVLARPVAQRFRAVAFVPALTVAIIAQLVAREVEGSRAAWAASAALFAAVCAVVYVATAMIAHAVRVPRLLAGMVGSTVVVWQVAAAVTTWNASVDGEPARLDGPADVPGSLLFWGIRQRGVDVVALVVAVGLIAVSLLVSGRLRLEPLERRGQLVSQLRFAATVQDIRTVVLLRRQLRAETIRSRPWFPIGAAPSVTPTAITRRSAGLGPALGQAKPHDRPPTEQATRAASVPPTTDGADRWSTPARPHRRRRARPTRSEGTIGTVPTSLVVRRGLIAIARLPVTRLARMVALAALAGVSASLVVTSSWLFAVPVVGLLFLLGLESLEPLAQEVDRPDLTDALPVDRGDLFSRHLLAPAGLVGVMALIGAVAASIVEPGHVAGAFALAIPVAWAGSIGAVVSTVRDAPAHAVVASTTITGRDRSSDNPFAVPEFAGASNIVTALVPIVCSAAAMAPIAAMRADPSVATALRSTIGVALCLAVMVWWVRRRDVWGARIRGFFVEGRAAA